ncbi:reverse transcriptase [Plakobranchus ocellatus]|uniref:Reverse transcriptase n=1 Tax=Plakobranchus ocellatus TaxID=259542 RepID=A0AAV3Y3K0_9GAST|nr:reverse transcriptase [Plakobranchus ocellatus]
MASRLTQYLTESGYVNVSLQEGALSGVLGCFEHATIIWEAIQRANHSTISSLIDGYDARTRGNCVASGLLNIYTVACPLQLHRDPVNRPDC